MHIPSLQTLRAFDAAGRHRSYSRAGAELGLTHSAVSHRIRDLEQLTGVRLFMREGNHMAPTADGQRLLAQVRNALGLLESIFGERREQAARRITVSVFPAFASRWLVPRLGQFRAAHPGVELALNLSSDVVALGDGIDAAVRFGAGGWPGTESRRLAGETLFPVCSPGYCDAHRLAAPADLLRGTLLRYPRHSWAAWFHAAGVSASEPRTGPEYSDSSLLMDAAVAGEGVALARGFAAFDALHAGTLVRPFETEVSDGQGYHFVTAPGPLQPQLEAFETWLRTAMTDEGTQDG